MNTSRTIVLAVGLLVVANVVANRVLHEPVAIGLALTGALLLVARATHMSAAELGLARGTWTGGLKWGGAAVGIVFVGYAAALAVPGLRDALADQAAPSPGETALRLLIVIPLGTVIPEELAFRGLLWGLLRRQGSALRASVISSGLFAVWHVLPALNLGPTNATIIELVGDGAAGTALRVAGTLAVTFTGGMLFCWFRWRSDSLLAPILLHLGINGVGEVSLFAIGQD